MLNVIYHEHSTVMDIPLLTAFNGLNDPTSSTTISEILEQAVEISRQLEVVMEQFLALDNSECGANTNEQGSEHHSKEQ